MLFYTIHVLVQLRVPCPAIVVNPAAYTAVDQADREPDLAFAITSGGPAVLADECQRLGALLVHYSTDYIFDVSVPNARAAADEFGIRQRQTPRPVRLGASGLG